MKQPKTWNELLKAGYVVELTAEQIASFRDKTGQLDRDWKYLTPEEQSIKNHEIEAKMRGLK